MSDERVKLEPSWKWRASAIICSALRCRQPWRPFPACGRSEAGKRIYPPGPEIFAAFEHTPFDAVRVVILGQDPYHGPAQAHGLCFSVRPGVRVPPSLENIFARKSSAIFGIAHGPDHGCLTPCWPIAAVRCCSTACWDGGEDGRARRCASGQRLGEGFYRCGESTCAQPRARGPGVPAVGLGYAHAEGAADRYQPPLRAECGTSIAAIGSSRFHRLRAFFRGQPLPWNPAATRRSTGRCRVSRCRIAGRFHARLNAGWVTLRPCRDRGQAGMTDKSRTISVRYSSLSPGALIRSELIARLALQPPEC